MKGILDEIRVVDLTTGLAGPVATMFLAEAGADVIKVERPEGDCLRGTPAFSTWNRSKRSIVLDLDRPDDLAVLENLVSQADVLVHSMGRSEAVGFGLDPDAVGRRFPKVIVCSVNDYPIGHPDEDRPGSDILVQARAGLMAEVVSRRPGPTFLRVPLPSWGAAYLACSGILVRLFVRQRYGTSGPVHTSLLQGALFFLNSIWKSATRPSIGLEQKLGVQKRPHPWMFTCADGRWIQPYVTFVQCVPFLEAVLSLGHEPPEVDFDPSDDDLELFRKVFATRTADEWLRDLWSHDVDGEILLHVGEVLQGDVAQEAGATVEVDDPRFGTTRQAAVPFSTEPPPEVAGPAPLLDQHGEEIRSNGWGTLPPQEPAVGVEPGAGPTPEHPLAGMRVLDLGVWISGPLCATLLGDLGAEVVKIESPAGDPSRLGDVFFLAGNRAKRALAMDLRNPIGRSVLTDLVRKADIVVHNMRPSKAQNLGVDYPSVRALKPDIVECEISAYTDHGPYAELPGRDTIVGALSGWTLDGGDTTTGPIWLRMMVGDTATAAAGLIATLLGIYHRERTGKGSRVSASLLRTATILSSETLIRLDDNSVVPIAASLPGMLGLSPGYRMYNVADGWLAVSTDEAGFDQFCTRFDVSPSEAQKVIQEMSRQEALSRLGDCGIAAEPIDPDPEGSFFTDQRNEGLGLVNLYDHLEYGRVGHPFGYWNFESMTCVRGVPAPTIGQHTKAILSEAGLSETDIAALAEKGLIRQHLA
jgi:crotonobetainyl-CoA:carnitine CoA-transferase CaiB-like acyl-CoA transferase